MNLTLEADSTALSRDRLTDAEIGSASFVADKAACAVNPFVAQAHRSLTTVEPLWRRLEREGHCTAYQSFDWIERVCEHLVRPYGVMPLFIEVRAIQTNACVMIVPLAINTRFGIKTLNWLSLGVCDYSAPMIAAGVDFSPLEAIQAWKAVRAVLPRIDVIAIDQIPDTVNGARNPFCLLPQCQVMDLVSHGVSFDREVTGVATSAMPIKARKEVLRRRRRLEELGDVRLVKAETEQNVTELFAVLMDQRRRRFQRLGRFDLLSRPHVAAFYHDVAFRSLHGVGPARLFGLRVGSEWIATAYVIEHAKVMHGLILAMGDEVWNKYSPGLVMVTELMEWSFQSDHVYHDLTVGNLPYKKDLGAESKRLLSVLEPLTVAGAAATRLRKAVVSTKVRLQNHPRLFDVLRCQRQRVRRVLNVLRGLRRDA